MSDRGMKKWNAYKSLVEQESAIKHTLDDTKIVEKPIISEDKIEEINQILTSYRGEKLTIKYYRNKSLTTVEDIIKKIDIYEKKLVLSDKDSVKFSEIVDIIKN